MYVYGVKVAIWEIRSSGLLHCSSREILGQLIDLSLGYSWSAFVVQYRIKRKI